MADAASSKSFNMRNPAVKRILQEVKEMAQEQSTEFVSMPLESDIFEWQFAIHGPKDSEFEGGIYHGRITLPADYPFKPPSFMLLTPSGRFEVQTKICLSISNHHPEHWQPSWSVRTALVALIAFMPTKPNGAIGSLEYTKKERRALAIKSRLNPPQFGSPERQSIIQQIHEAMLGTAPPVPTTPLVEDEPAGPNGHSAGENEPKQAPAPSQQTQAQPPADAPASALVLTAAGQAQQPAPAQSSPAVEREGQPPASSSSGRVPSQATLGAPVVTQRPAVAQAAAALSAARSGQGGSADVQRPVHRLQTAALTRSDSETLQERALSAIAALLVVAILFILGQKIARAYTGLTFTGGESEL